MLRLQLGSLSAGVPSSNLEKEERLVLGHVNYVFIHESVTRCVKQRQVTRGIVDLICYKKWIGKRNTADLQH